MREKTKPKLKGAFSQVTFAFISSWSLLVLFEALKKLLTDETRIRQRKNLIQTRSFEELLDKAIKPYTNQSIEAAEIIQQLIDLVKKMRDEQQRGIKLNLTEEEVAFYDAFADNESTKQVLGDETLHKMAREIVETVRKKR
jgi:type I restriction enzyme R subunit